ncbi:hypothetical protein [Leptobacterium sp. I13]|uniref:hypothetical protein n=1 Tax=Leptobacterium meishanense TaxID=3128904 RepID=UPI0030EBF653
MKKLDNFYCEKVDLNSIYGGQAASIMGTYDSNTVTVGPGAPKDGNDGDDEGDDPWSMQ